MSYFSYFVTRDKSCGNIYNICANPFEKTDHEKLIIKDYGVNWKWMCPSFLDALFSDVILENQYHPSVEHGLLACLKARAAKILAGDDTTAHLVSCSIHDDLSLSFNLSISESSSMNEYVQLRTKWPDNFIEQIEFTAVRYFNDEIIEIIEVDIFEDEVFIKEQRNSTRTLNYKLVDRSRIFITEFN